MLVIEGKDIDISSEFEKYNSLRKFYLQLSDDLSDEFFDDFIATFDDMDDLFLRFKPVAIGYMERAVDASIRELILMGINDISDEVFIEKYVQKYSQLEHDCLEVFDRYMKIVLDIEEYEEYKKTRSSGGGSVIGGGFGVEGAVKGVAIASAANLAIGAVGGILNSIADSIKESNNKREKDLLFNSKDTRDSLRTAVFNLVFCVHYGLVDAVDDNIDDKVYELVSDESAEKARSLLVNLTKGRISENEVKKVLIDALRLNPYNADLYEYWFEIYGDEDQHLLALEEYFGVVNSRRNALVDSLSTEFASDVSDDTSLGKELVSDTTAKSEAIDSVRPDEDSVKEDEHFFGGHRYDSVEKANRLRYEYIKAFLKSEKSTGDIDDKVELMKVINKDKQKNKKDTLLGGLVFCALISMFFITWWYGLLFIVAIGLISVCFEGNIHKNALKRWVADYEEKNGLEG